MTDSTASHKSFFSRAFILLLVLSGVAAAIIYTRISQHNTLQKDSSDDAIPSVVVVQPEAGPGNEELVLPGELQAYLEAPIYARASGYIKKRFVEMGDKVKAGEVLAEIDNPELDQQLKQAEADLATAQANYDLAQTTADRWQNLQTSHFVSKQDTDQKVGEAAAKKTLVTSAKANVDRLRELASFKRVTAPFDGVVTARKTDVGTLITAGTGSGPELFHIADMHKLRVFVQVPQSQAMLIQTGMAATLRLSEQPGVAVPAKLVRTSSAIDQNTHSLLAELEVDNANNTLIPGGYTEVHIPLLARPGSVRIPSSALLFGSQGLRVAVVNSEAHAILKPVVVGRDFGKQIEIVSGLDIKDKVIRNPSDAISNDQPVNMITEAPPATDTKSGEKK